MLLLQLLHSVWKCLIHAKKENEKKMWPLRCIATIEEKTIKNLQNKPSPPEVPEPSMMLPSPGTRVRYDQALSNAGYA